LQVLSDVERVVDYVGRTIFVPTLNAETFPKMKRILFFGFIAFWAIGMWKITGHDLFV